MKRFSLQHFMTFLDATSLSLKSQPNGLTQRSPSSNLQKVETPEAPFPAMADEPKPEPIQQPSPSQDTPNKTRTTPPGTKRLILTLTVLFSFVLALPILLKSTQIYRSPLPFKSIQSLSAQLETHPPSLPCHFHSIFLGFDSNPDNLGFSISNQMKELHKNDPICGGCGSNYSISVTIDSGTRCVHNAENQCSWPCGLMGSELDEKWKNDDEGFDEFLQSFGAGFCLDFPGRVYTVVVVNRGDEEEEEGFGIVAGKYRNAWIKGRVSEFKAVDLVGKIFVKLFMNGGKEEGLVQGKGEFMPVAADGSAVLSFSLLNANPNDWIYDWDFKKIDDTLLFPVVEALAPIANISVESQVLYHTPKASQSSWDEKLASYVFSTKDLPFFVNSNEWHLDTSVAAAGRSKILQFVVYIPSAQECPLVLQLPNGEISMTNGFISPMWGGVIVWNPPGCVRNSQSMHPSRHTFSPQDLEKVFQVFVGQVRLLFGLKSNSLYIDETTVSDILASERGFAEWELDVLIRHHASFNLRSCVTTLGSLSRLVQSLPSMVVMDEIGKQVKFSLEAATLAQNNASLGIYDAVAVSSRQARTLAEDAFFHPSIMSLLYFPIEHHIAIYMPFFVPVSMHVLLAAFRELKRYRLERAKYLVWKSQLQPT